MTSTNPSTAQGTDDSSTGKSGDSVTLLTADEAIVLKAQDIGLSTSKKCSTACPVTTSYSADDLPLVDLRGAHSLQKNNNNNHKPNNHTNTTPTQL